MDGGIRVKGIFQSSRKGLVNRAKTRLANKTEKGKVSKSEKLTSSTPGSGLFKRRRTTREVKRRSLERFDWSGVSTPRLSIQNK